MATTGRSQKSKSVLDRDRYTADFTSGQLVIAICSLLLTALLCFLLGVVVGRYERGIERSRLAEVAQEAVAEVKEIPAPVIAQPPPAPPKPVVQAVPAPVARVEPPVEPAPVPEAPVHVVQSGEPKPITAAPLPDEPTARPTPVVEPPAPAPTPAPAPQPAAVPPAPAPQPAAAPAPAVSEASSGSRFGIQLAAFGDMGNAQKARERLLKNSQLEADLVQAGQWVRVIIGDYRDRKEAEAACEELKQKPGFRDCYVVARPD